MNTLPQDSRNRFFGITFLVSVLFTVSVFGAGLFTETYTGGSAGWSSSGQGSISFSSDAVNIQFSALALPFPETASLGGDSGSSGGMFTGDYSLAGVQRMGFDFTAFQDFPSLLKLEWKSGTNTYFRELKTEISQLNTPFTFSISLDSQSQGGWVGTSSSEAVFESAKQSVDELFIRVGRGGEAAQAYRIDNVYLDAPPKAESIQSSSSNAIEITWTSLRSNLNYQVESLDNLDQSWTNRISFKATNTTETILITPSAPASFLRISHDDS